MAKMPGVSGVRGLQSRGAQAARWLHSQSHSRNGRHELRCSDFREHIRPGTVSQASRTAIRAVESIFCFLL